MQPLIGYFTVAAFMLLGAWFNFKRTTDQIVESVSLMILTAGYIAWNVTHFRDFTTEIVMVFFAMGCAGLVKCIKARQRTRSVASLA